MAAIELGSATGVDVTPPRRANNWRILSVHIDVINRRVSVQIIRALKVGNSFRSPKEITRTLEGQDYTDFVQSISPAFKNRLITALKNAGDVPSDATEV